MQVAVHEELGARGASLHSPSAFSSTATPEPALTLTLPRSDACTMRMVRQSTPSTPGSYLGVVDACLQQCVQLGQQRRVIGAVRRQGEVGPLAGVRREVEQLC